MNGSCYMNPLNVCHHLFISITWPTHTCASVTWRTHTCAWSSSAISSVVRLYTKIDVTDVKESHHIYEWVSVCWNDWFVPVRLNDWFVSQAVICAPFRTRHVTSMCCSLLQSVAVCCSLLQSVVVPDCAMSQSCHIQECTTPYICIWYIYIWYIYIHTYIQLYVYL